MEKKTSLLKNNTRAQWNSIGDRMAIPRSRLKAAVMTSGIKYKVPTVVHTFFREFCNNSSLHAFNQVAKPMYSIYERLLWSTLFVLGVLGTTYTCRATWNRYQASTTSTVIETTRYSYANVPFPAVTICDKSRVDWPRALELTPDDIPEPFELNKGKMLTLLKRVAYAGFGDFDFFDQLRLENSTDFTSINDVNMTNILLKVMRPCEEMFFEWCWFRDLEYDCCRIFELQKTEFGFCWSFNSDTAEPSRNLSKGWPISGKDHWFDSQGRRRPWRTAQHGAWSGLRFNVIPLPEERLPPGGNHTTTGISIAVSDPKGEMHSNFLTVGPGLSVRMPVWGENLFATSNVRKVSFQARQCLFPDEDPFGLSQGFYLAANCLVACYQSYTLRYCNCSPDFIFYSRDGRGNNFKPCDAHGLLCLSEFNDIFTYEVPPVNSEFFPSTKTGINCTCPADCTSQLYVSDMASPVEGNISTCTEIDVHFRLDTCTRYRTDVVFEWLDIVVSFGGIAGLFLGASLLSAAETLYFCTVRFLFIWLRSRQSKKVPKPIDPFLH